MTWETTRDPYAFGKRLAKVLGDDPSYYPLLVSDEPTRRMWDVVESLALDGDPARPETTVKLFKDLAGDLPEEQVDRWLAGLRDAAQQVYRSTPPSPDETLVARLLRLVYADPKVYELVASVEPGYGLLEVVENLAIEGDVDDVEDMLRLVRELAD